MTADNKVMVMGLDGAAMPLIEKWSSQGHLPFFSRLMQEGTWGLLKSTPSFGSASAWPSFHTGLNPGRHGMFDFFFKPPHSYTMRWMTKRYFAGKPFWQIASDQGVKSAIVNLPVTYPAAAFKGIQVAGWMTPDTSADGFTSPQNLDAEIEKNVGKHVFAPSVKAEVNKGRYEAACRSMQNAFDYKLRLCRYLLQKNNYSIFAHAWIAHDQVGHYFWHLLDENHPRFDPELSRKYAPMVLDVYKWSDSALAELHGKYGGHLIVMSDHGHGPNTLGEPHLKSLLKETGLMKMKGGAGKKSGAFSQAVGKIFETMQGLLGRPLKRFLIANFPGLLNFALTRQNLADIDWQNTRVYTFIEPTLNLQGREPQGSVSSAEAETTLDKVEEILYSVRDTRTGKKAVEKVYRKENVYHGHFTDNAPDLLVIWNQDIVVDKLELRFEGRHIITESHYTDHRSGNHKPYGIVFAKGEGILPGLRDDTMEIIDLCPLILFLAGCRIPDNLDGKLPARIFKDSYLNERPIEYFGGDKDESDHCDYYGSKEEKKAAEKRLSDLGYL